MSIAPQDGWSYDMKRFFVKKIALYGVKFIDVYLSSVGW